MIIILSMCVNMFTHIDTIVTHCSTVLRIMDLKYAQIRSQLLRIAHCNLVCSALYSKIRKCACVFIRVF
jgi:hypothetical protein